MRPLLLLATAASLAGCATAVPVGGSIPISPETVPSCTRACKAVGMKVGAIIFIQNMGGCVCEPEAPAPAEPGAARPAATMGGAAAAASAVLAIEAAQQRDAQQTSPQGTPR